MKKLINVIFLLFIILSIFCFIGCPLLFLGDDLKDFKCITAEELTDYMNSLDFGTSFTLKDSNYTETSSYKCLIVELEAADLPGKTVTACQCYSFYNDFPYPARMTVPTVQEYRFTDYYYCKFEDDILSKIEELYSPILKGFERDKSYKLAFTADPYHWGPSLTNTDKVKYYKDAKTFIESRDFNIEAYCLINKELLDDSEFSRRYNAFRYDLEQDYTIRIFHNFYFTTKYKANEITAKDLISDKYSQFKY